jgi:hypothetical protein
MARCWAQAPDARPAFAEVKAALAKGQSSGRDLVEVLAAAPEAPPLHACIPLEKEIAPELAASPELAAVPELAASPSTESLGEAAVAPASPQACIAGQTLLCPAGGKL